MSKRINIVLPDKTLAVLDRVATKGKRSQFISRAVLHFIESQGVSGTGYETPKPAQLWLPCLP
jgi:metal-responsive CopG/Arc/MetJ family transcriptional regulator